MSITDWTGRLTTIGASANEVAAITAAYYADPQNVQAALDTLVNGLSNAGLLIMLNTWRTSGGPFAAGFPSGGLPFGTGVAVLTGNPADDAFPIAAGTGVKMTSILPGAELAYAQITSAFASVTATTAATAQDVGLTTGAVTYAAVPVLVEFFTPKLDRGTGSITIVLYDGATQLGILGSFAAAGSSSLLKTRITPSAGSHTYLPKAFVDAGTGQVEAGNGAAGNQVPAYFRITRV